MAEMKAQYQTSLGLGTPFNRDSGSRGRRRGQAGKPRRGGRGFSSGHQQPFFGAASYSNTAGVPGTTQPIGSYGRGSPVSVRGRGVCYSYQAGN